MPPTPKNFWIARSNPPHEFMEAFAEVFEETAQTVSWYEEAATQQWQMDALYSARPSLEALQEKMDLRARLLQQPSPRVTLHILPEQDWLAENFRAFPPLTIGRFYLYGSHDTGEIPAGKIGLHLDAATAFGSGRHETTQGCLRALQELAETYPWQKPLDLGCGSGILALAMAFLRPEAVVIAADCDPEAVRVTRQNCLLNHQEAHIHVLESEGFSSSFLQDNGPYDLIVANILPPPLHAMASQMAQHSSGLLILSGILNTQATALIKLYEGKGFSLLQEKLLNTWSTLIFSKVLL